MCRKKERRRRGLRGREAEKVMKREGGEEEDGRNSSGQTIEGGQSDWREQLRK